MIKTDADYGMVLDLVEKIIDLDPPLETIQSYQLQTMVSIIKDYEKIRWPGWNGWYQSQLSDSREVWFNSYGNADAVIEQEGGSE